MAITSNKTTIALATSAALTAGMALSPMVVNAEANPFQSAELSSGYMQLAEGNCGAKKMEHEADKAKEGNCGDKKMEHAADKAKEGNCGDKKMEHEADKAKEGNCGGKK